LFAGFKMVRTFLLMGSGVMFFAVAAGAFGAHGLQSYLDRYPELEPTFSTAVRYQLFHGLAILITAWIADKWPAGLAGWAGSLFFVGILLFSGSLYLLVLSRARWLGMITPLGGMAFLGGWLILFIEAWRH